jgi:hypothetical protein
MVNETQHCALPRLQLAKHWCVSLPQESHERMNTSVRPQLTTTTVVVFEKLIPGGLRKLLATDNEVKYYLCCEQGVLVVSAVLPEDDKQSA